MIRNALDIYADSARLKEGLERELADMSAIGLQPEALDLRLFFGRAGELGTRVDEFGCVWVTGGNSFVLRRAFSESGFDAILSEKLAEDDFVYAGYSAGACVITSTLEGIHLADDPQAMPAGGIPETAFH